MAGRRDAACRKVADFHRIVLGNLHIDRRDFGGLRARRCDLAVIFLLQFGNAAGVIAMMVGDENVGELPAGFLQRGLDGRCLRRIDRRRRAGCRIVYEDAVIILQAAEQMGLRGHGEIPDS